MASAPLNSEAILQLCQPALVRKLGGDIQTISESSTRRSHGGAVIEGRLTASVGMGPPQPGYASAHHLIRGDFTFRCRVRDGIVRDATVVPLR